MAPNGSRYKSLQSSLQIAVACSLLLLTLSSDPKCQENGFSGEQSCADCDKLLQYVGDEGLAEECRHCCSEEGPGTASVKFKKAVLEVCHHRLREYPHIEGFIDTKADDYESLSISYKFASFPKLILKSGKQKEVIRIDHWKGEHIAEYLKDRLE